MSVPEEWLVVTLITFFKAVDLSVLIKMKDQKSKLIKIHKRYFQHCMFLIDSHKLNRVFLFVYFGYTSIL